MTAPRTTSTDTTSLDATRPRIAIIVGSTRPGRTADTVAGWVHDIATQRDDAAFEVVDIADYELPLLDEPVPAAMGRYRHDHTKAWSAAIAAFDGYVFVTPEYNHSTSAALKNALDYLSSEWNDKAAGFVGYGGAGGTRAVEHLRPVMGELQIADVRAQVSLSLVTDFTDNVFTPAGHQESAVTSMLDQVVAWSRALQPLRVA